MSHNFESCNCAVVHPTIASSTANQCDTSRYGDQIDRNVGYFVVVSTTYSVTAKTPSTANTFITACSRQINQQLSGLNRPAVWSICMCRRVVYALECIEAKLHKKVGSQGDRPSTVIDIVRVYVRM